MDKKNNKRTCLIKSTDQIFYMLGINGITLGTRLLPPLPPPKSLKQIVGEYIVNNKLDYPSSSRGRMPSP